MKRFCYGNLNDFSKIIFISKKKYDYLEYELSELIRVRALNESLGIRLKAKDLE